VAFFCLWVVRGKSGERILRRSIRNLLSSLEIVKLGISIKPVYGGNALFLKNLKIKIRVAARLCLDATFGFY